VLNQKLQPPILPSGQPLPTALNRTVRERQREWTGTKGGSATQATTESTAIAAKGTEISNRMEGARMNERACNQ
jgi:hypothetical protein